MKYTFFITPLDSQKNSASDSSTRFSNLGSKLGTNEVLNSFVYSHFSLASSVKSDSIVQTCYELIDSTCEIYLASIYSIVYKQWITSNFRFFYNYYGVGTAVILDFYCADYTIV